MRINIYGEELTRRVEVKTTTITEPDNEFKLFGIRLYLGFPFLHRTGDDDTSAVTLWVPKLNDGTHDVQLLEDALIGMLAAVQEIKQLAPEHGGVNKNTEE